MVSFSSLYETSIANTNLPPAIFLANHGDSAHAVGPHRAEPHRAAHYPLGD
jgi:hypothetical protein